MGAIFPGFNAVLGAAAMLGGTRGVRRHRIAVWLGGAAALALMACAPTVDNRGHLPAADRLAEIQPGKTTKEEVVRLLGTPSSTGIFDDKKWYYISKKTEQVAFFDKDVLDQQVYQINFDNQGVVKGVEHKDLKDAQAVEPAPGATPAPGRELTFIEQIIGNVGRFSGTPSTSQGTGR
jgi:outer membrane protein assembly factor BamE (lipoprotein component of BamABCDE complex)